MASGTVPATIATMSAPSTTSITGLGNRYDASTAMKERVHMAKVNEDRTDARRRLDSVLESCSRQAATLLDSSLSSSLVDAFRVDPPEVPGVPGIEDFEPRMLADDPSFKELLELNRELVDAFRAYDAASERKSRRDAVEKVLSISVAILSLAVSFVSLLAQFGVIG